MARERNAHHRIIEHPVTKPAEKDYGGHGATVTTHPAYGQIGANRVSGSKTLYGSDFNHGGFVRITLKKSQVKRDLSSDWPFAREQLFSVDLSEAQWANFVSAMNIGEGTQCTINWTHEGPVPELPDPVDRRAQYAGESAATAAKVKEKLDLLEDALKGLGLSQKKLDTLIGPGGLVTAARQAAGTNQDFVAASFAKHMEKTVQKANMEVNAYINAAVRQVGLENLKGVGMNPQMLGGPEE